MKNYQVKTPQNLALTIILQKFRKTSTPHGHLNFTVKRFRFIVGTQSWKRLIIIKCENENGKSNADYIKIGVFLMH